MEIKKSKNANLEKRRGTHLLIGLILSMAFVWMSFEYKSYDKMEQVDMSYLYNGEEEDVIIQNTIPEKIEPPKVILITNFVSVDNSVDVPDLEFTVEFDEGDEVDEYILLPDDEADDPNELTIFCFVEESPSFPGGESELMRFLAQIKYPEMAKEAGIQGTVYITFVVEKDGRVSNVALLRGIGSGCDKESLRIVKKMPKWKPGKQRERPVRVQLNVPIHFILKS